MKETKIGFSHLMIIGILLVLPSLFPYASAEITVEWIVDGFSGIDEMSISLPNHDSSGTLTVEVFDDESAFTAGIDAIDVLVTSSLDGIGTNMTLIETGAETNTFTGDTNFGPGFVPVLESSYRFSADSTVTVFVDGGPDDCTVGLDFLDSVGDFTGVFIYSDTEVENLNDGIGLFLEETGPDTCRFEGTLTFTTVGPSDWDLGILHVSDGDILTFLDEVSGEVTLAQIIPTVAGKGSILSEFDDPGFPDADLTVTYLGMSDGLDLDDDGAEGRGGGGLVRPGLVADSPNNSGSSSSNSGNGSGCGGDCIPPTLGVDSSFKRMVSDGFSYNDNPIDVEQFFTPYPLVTVQVGEQNRAILKIYDNGGTQNIAHVELGFGLGKDESFSENRAAVILDISRDGRQSVTTFDPENVLDNVSIVTMKDRCGNIVSSQCLVVMIDHTFREPLEFNMVGTQVWDHKKNSWQNFYNHGVHIIGDSLNPPKTKEVAFGTKEMSGLFTLTQIHKIDDKWIDEFGNIYQHKGNDRFDLIEKIPDDMIEDFITMHGCDRHCNWFEKYKQNQELIAQSKFEAILGEDITKDMPGFSPAPKSSIVSRQDNVLLQKSISFEIHRAQETFVNEFYFKHNLEFLPLIGKAQPFEAFSNFHEIIDINRQED